METRSNKTRFNFFNDRKLFTWRLWESHQGKRKSSFELIFGDP